MGSGVSKRWLGRLDPYAPSSSNGVASFRHGTPTVAYDEAIGCFHAVNYTTKATSGGAVRKVTTTSVPAYLYRLVNHATGEWYFYNDTKSYTFTVTGYFGRRNAIEPLGSARMYREMPSDLLIVELTVGPLETAPYIVGDVCDGFDLTFAATRGWGQVVAPTGASRVSRSSSRGRPPSTPSLMEAGPPLSTTGSLMTGADGRAWISSAGGTMVTLPGVRGTAPSLVERTASPCPLCSGPTSAPASAAPTPQPPQPLSRAASPPEAGDSPAARAAPPHHRVRRHLDSTSRTLPSLSRAHPKDRASASPSVGSGVGGAGLLTGSGSASSSKATSNHRESSAMRAVELSTERTRLPHGETEDTAQPDFLPTVAEESVVM